MGAACLLMGDSGLILEVQSPHKWITLDGDVLSIGLGCIGGGIEEGETPMAALQREALEEIGCPLAVQSATETIEVLADGQTQARPWSLGQPRPLLVWEARAAGIIREGKGVVYLGYPDGVPKPCDLGALLTLPLEQALRLGSRPQSVADIISTGADLQERVHVPTTAVLALGGTLAVLYRLYRDHRAIADRILAAVHGMQRRGRHRADA